MFVLKVIPLIIHRKHIQAFRKFEVGMVQRCVNLVELEKYCKKLLNSICLKKLASMQRTGPPAFLTPASHLTITRPGCLTHIAQVLKPQPKRYWGAVTLLTVAQHARICSHLQVLPFPGAPGARRDPALRRQRREPGLSLPAKMHFSRILQIFGGLVLGCIKTKFCNKICV